MADLYNAIVIIIAPLKFSRVYSEFKTSLIFSNDFVKSPLRTQVKTLQGGKSGDGFKFNLRGNKQLNDIKQFNEMPVMG